MRGPRLLVEFMESLRSAGLSFTTHHLEWLRRSDVAPGAAVVREHFHASESLRWYGQFDHAAGPLELRQRGAAGEEAGADRDRGAEEPEGP